MEYNLSCKIIYKLLGIFLFQNPLLLCNLDQITKGSNKHQRQVTIKDRKVKPVVAMWSELREDDPLEELWSLPVSTSTSTELARDTEIFPDKQRMALHIYLPLLPPVNRSKRS